jgi:hypothetical protein
MIFFFLRLVHHELMKTGRSLFIRTNKGALSFGRASSKLQFIFTGQKYQLGDNYHFGNECRFQPKFFFLFFSRTESVHLTSAAKAARASTAFIKVVYCSNPPVCPEPECPGCHLGCLVKCPHYSERL